MSKVPSPAAKRHDTAYIGRGSMAVPLVIQDESGLIEERPQKRRNAKGKKARKAAARLASAREAQSLVEPARGDVAVQTRRAKRPAQKGKARPKPPEAARPEQLPAIPAANAVRGTYSPSVKLLAVPAPTLPVRPEPQGEGLAEPIEAEVAPEPETAPALAEMPLPRARALVPARRQGLIDVIAFLLRDSGRRLARWSARRHETRAEQAALRRAEAQQINLQRELEALDALRWSNAQGPRPRSP
ncbi:hypothetical protein [Novosphingobium sp.]|uniref:hypothetical protein n=1 Tax=Novosphingobium sp. TaxID=1874826 RepID=UPI003BAA1223